MGESKAERRAPSVVQMLLLAALGVLLMLAGTLIRSSGSTRAPEDGGAKPVAQAQAISAPRAATEAERYRVELAQRLATMLSAVEGAGAVRVDVTLASGPGKVYAQNSTVEEKTSEDQGTGQTRRTSESRRTTEVVLAPDQAGKGQAPVVVREEMPGIAGVLVCAPGAGDPKVRRELAEAAATLLGVGVHRVKVVTAVSQVR